MTAPTSQIDVAPSGVVRSRADTGESADSTPQPAPANVRSTDDSATDRGSTARSESVCASRPDVVSRPSPSRECDHRTHGIGLSAGVATIGNGAPAVAFVNWFTNRPASDWDMVLVTVLSLLVGGLVGIRLAYVLSAREISVTLGGSLSDPAGDEPTDDQHSTGHEFHHAVSASTPSLLLSDEGEVIKLLMQNDGTLRQHQIASETGWSKSKVSRILSDMHDEGVIEKISIGRENHITLVPEAQQE